MPAARVCATPGTVRDSRSGERTPTAERCFASDLDTSAAAIARTILNLADNLGLKSVAKGVETEAQKAFLQDNGCHTLQGFLFAQPQPADQCEALLEQGMDIPWARPAEHA